MSKPIIMGVDLASGPDRSVAVAMRKEDDGSLRILACEELPPGTVAVVGFTLEDNVPLPAPKGAATGRVVMPHGFSETVPRFKSSLVVRIVPPDFEGGSYRVDVRGARGTMAYGDAFGPYWFASREEANRHMSAACAQYWRRYG